MTSYFGFLSRALLRGEPLIQVLLDEQNLVPSGFAERYLLLPGKLVNRGGFQFQVRSRLSHRHGFLSHVRLWFERSGGAG